MKIYTSTELQEKESIETLLKKHGIVEGVLLDSNGNKVGQFYLNDKE
jgi:hypothetical protein